MTTPGMLIITFTEQNTPTGVSPTVLVIIMSIIYLIRNGYNQSLLSKFYVGNICSDEKAKVSANVSASEYVCL